jgi:two-component SAPR family response regulator
LEYIFIDIFKEIACDDDINLKKFIWHDISLAQLEKMIQAISKTVDDKEPA